MSDPGLLSYLEGMKENFWQEHRHLQEDEIKLQWTGRVAPYLNILNDPEAPARPPARPLELASPQGSHMARQFTAGSWAEASSHLPGTITPLKFPQHCDNFPSSEAMSRKRARTLQHGSGPTAKNAIDTQSLDTNVWQQDSNAPYFGYTHASTSGPSFKARRTSTGRIPINVPEESPDIKVYEPADYVQQTKPFPSSSLCPNTRPQNNLNNHCVLPSCALPSPFSTSPTTTSTSENLTNTTTPPTSTAMSRHGSLGASFYGAFEMMRAGSGSSEVDLGQNRYRQDSYYDTNSDPFSPDGQDDATLPDTSILFAHTGGTAIEASSASMLAAEQRQLPATLELDTEPKKNLSPSSIPLTEKVQSPSTLELHTRMMRNASSDSNLSSTSRISRRSQEQIAQAARPIAPKDVIDSAESKQSLSSLSVSQDMHRQRSAPEPKIPIAKVPYSRHSKVKLKCNRCNKNPDGYRGSHELHRHMALDHNALRTAWVCVDISSDGFLSGCAACASGKPYGQDYNAAAHLRRFHFHPKSGVRRINVDPEERRGGKGGGKHPSMNDCRQWMKKIQVCGKDFTALAEGALNDTGDDIVDSKEESKEEHGEEEQGEVTEDPFSSENVENYDETFQSPDSPAVQQNVSSLYGATPLNSCLTDDGQFNLKSVDLPFGQSGFHTPAFESPFEYNFDTNVASLTTPSIGPAYSHSTLSSSAPAAPSYLNNYSAELARAHNNFDSSTPESYDMPSSMSTTRNAHTSEDFNNFQTSYRHGNFPYGPSSPDNPNILYGLLDSSPLP